MFHNEPCIYDHRIFTRSAAIYAAVRRLPPPQFANRLDSPSPSLSINGQASNATSATSTGGRLTAKDASSAQDHEFDFESRAEKRLSFTLVFQTLKCK
jgi:hypothetical protein